MIAGGLLGLVNPEEKSVRNVEASTPFTLGTSIYVKTSTYRKTEPMDAQNGNIADTIFPSVIHTFGMIRKIPT